MRLDPLAPREVRHDASADLTAYRQVTEGRALYALGRFADVVPLLNDAVVRDPGYAVAWALLSKAESRLEAPGIAPGRANTGNLNAALAHAKRAESIAPDLAEVHVALALAYRGLHDRPHMREAAERAATIDPRSGEPLIILGDALSVSPGYGCPTEADPVKSEAVYRQGLRIEPLLGTGYVNLTTLLWWMDRPVDALATIDEGLSVAPQNRTLNTTRPFNLLFAGRLDEAGALLEQRITSGPQAATLDAVSWALLALRRKNFAEADRLEDRRH